MIRTPAAILALAGLFSLSACGPGTPSASSGPGAPSTPSSPSAPSDARGPGGSDFVTRFAAACVSRGQQSAARCACATRMAETELNDKEKTLLLASIDAADMDTEASIKAFNDSGLTPADLASIAERMAAVERRSETECPA